MSIIYSYPEQTALNDNDTLLGTSAALVGGKKKNITRNFSLSELSNYFGVGSIINPIASDFKLAVFNQSGTKITDSIISQDALAGTSVTIAGNLTANTTTLNGLLTVNGGANLGTGAAGELIAFGSTTRLNAPIQDQLGVVGTLDQILISDTAGRVSWQNYTSGLTYTGTWDAANNTTAPQGVPLVSSVGTNGEFYIVTVAGNTQLNGQPVTPTTPPYWNVGDWVVFVENGAAGVWQKIDNTSVLTGTGTDNKIAMWTGGATPSVTLTDSLISQDAGASTVTVAGAFTSTGNINGVNITGTGDLSGVNLLLTGTVSLNAQLGNSGQVLTSQGTADAIWANPTPVNNITGSGTANTLSMFTGQYTVGDSAITQSADALTVDVLTKTVTDANAYTINTNIGKLTRSGVYPNPGALTSNVTIGAQYTYGNVNMYGSQMELHTYNPPGYAGSPITLWSSSTAGLGIQLRTDGGSISNIAGTYGIQATGAGSGTNPEAVQISSNTGIKFQGQGNAANINFRSYNTNLLDSGDINFISETVEGQAGNVSFSSIATDANGTAGEIRLAGAGISTSATDAVPLGLVIASNGHVKTGSVGDTYTLGSSTDGSNVKLNLDAANGTDSAVTLTGAGGLTIAQTNDIVTLTAPAGSDTTYTLAAGVKSATSVPLNLTPSTGSGTAVNLTEGTGITLTQTSATEITIAGVAQGVTGSGTVGKLPKFDTSTSLNDSIIEQGGGTTTITPTQAGAISFNMQTSSFSMQQFQTRNTITGPTPQVGDVFNFVLQQDLTWAVGGGVIPAGTYPFTVTFIGSGTMSCNFNSYSTGSGATGTGYTNLIGNGSSTSVSSSSTLSIDGELSMLTHKITNVVNPSNAQDAATKNYVDSIPRGVMTFGTSDSGATITVSGGAPDPRVKANTTGGVGAGSTSLATGAQIQTAITNSAANYLPLAGGTMTGAIALPGSPTLALEAATKSYVDNTLAGSGSLIFQGSYDAVNNVPNLTSGTGILKGWTYAVTAGPSTSFWSPPLDVGDLVIANIDNPASASDWTEVQSNIGVAGSGATDGATVKGIAGFNSADFDVSNDGWVEAKDFTGTTPGYVPDATGATAGTFLKEDGTWSTAGVTGTGTQNYVTKWSAGGAGIENSTIFDNGTNVGIGTSTPASLLSVRTAGTSGSQDFATFSRGISTEYEVLKISRSAGSVEFLANQNITLSADYDNNHTGVDSNIILKTDNAERMRINSGGNVGIGTASPSAGLSVVKTDADGTLSQLTTGVSDSDVRFRAHTDAWNGILSLYDSGSNEDVRITSKSGEDSWFNNGGNVGIGTDSPLAKTQISTTLSSGSTQNALLLSQNTSTSASGQGVKMFLSSSNSVTRAAAIEAIAGSSNDHSLGFYTNSAFSNPTEKMRIDSSGNVGIGTDSPEVSLDLGNNADAIRVPNGPTADRPSGILPGMIRYNTSTSEFEGYSGTLNVSGSWGALGGGVSSVLPSSTGLISSGQPLVITPASGTGTVTIESTAYAGQSNVGHVPAGGLAGQYLDGGTGGWSTLPAGYTSWTASSDQNTNITVTDTTNLPFTGRLASDGAYASIPNESGIYTDTAINTGEVTIGLINNGGTPSATTFYRGDGQWATPSGASATITTRNAVGDGTNLTFALGATPNGSSVNFVDAFIDGVYQEVSTYSISGTDLVFNAGNAPATGTNVETKTTADYNVGAVVTTASLGQANTTGNVNLRIIPNYIISNTTAQANNLYIFDSTTQAYTLTLPSSPQPGDSIKISIRGGLATNILAVPATENIMGGVLGNSLVINNANAAFEIIYSGDSTKQGWVIIGNV